VFHDAVPYFFGEIKAFASLFKKIHHAEALFVVLETAGVYLSEDVLAGVAERGMAQVVRQGDGLGEVLVEPQGARDGARYLADLEHVREARAVVVAFGSEEDLCLVLEPAE
jgi:hypothetical protein